jgi:hypothetical protein
VGRAYVHLSLKQFSSGNLSLAQCHKILTSKSAKLVLRSQVVFGKEAQWLPKGLKL